MKQYVTFNGFNTSSSNAGTSQVINENSNTFQFIYNQSQTDIYSGNNNRKGFRLKGQFKLNDINYSNIISAVGAAQATAHTIKYKYVRDTDVDDTPNMTVSNDVYIDTLPDDPYIGAHDESATVKSVIWTMGIPSVKTIDISLSRTYKYINSTNKFIPGNRIIGKIKDIRKTNKTQDKSIVLARTNAGISGSENKAIDSGGEYVYTTAEFGVATSNYYNGAYYDEAIGISSTNSTLQIDEQVISLKKEIDISLFSISVTHFFDRESYNNYGSSSISRKFNYSYVYQISDSTNIAKLGSDLGAVSISQISDHTLTVKDWTLLYLSGRFRTNGNQTYPNVNSYQYDGVSSIVNGSGQYSAGSTEYALDGTTTGSGNKYKWIVFRIDKSNTTYVKSASKVGGGVAKPYIDVAKLLIDHGFSSSVYNSSAGIAKGYDAQNVIGFVRINGKKNSGGTGFQIGNFTMDVYNLPSKVWYSGDNSASISLSTLLNQVNGAAYGARIDTTNYNVDNGWGVECPDPNASGTFDSIDTNIDIFVGVKNSVSIM